MRASGSTAAMSANGMLTISAVRAASRSCVMVMVAPAAAAIDAPRPRAPAMAPATNFFIDPPDVFRCQTQIMRPGDNRKLGNDLRRIDDRPEGPLGIERGVEEQWAIGAVHREAVEPGVVVREAPQRHRLDAGAVE